MQAKTARYGLVRVLVATLPPLLAGADAAALTVTFIKKADTATPIPGGSGAFTSFGRNPSIDGGFAVAFRGDGEAPTPVGPAQQGIYSNLSGSLAVVADQGTPSPGGAGSFESFPLEPSSDVDYGASWGGGGAAGQAGIYRDAGSGAERLADRNTLLPGGQSGELFDLFVFPPASDGDDVVFPALGDGGALGPPTVGVYRASGGALAALVDSNTTMPGTSENFDFISRAHVDAGVVAFRGWSASGFDGVYRIDVGLETVADENTLAPSGLPFQSFGGDPVPSGDAVVFRGTDVAGLSGIFRAESGIALVADETTPIPEGGGATFEIFGDYAIDGDLVVFEGIGAAGSQAGLYAHHALGVGGTLEKIVDLGDSIQGKSVSELELSGEAVSGNDVAFWARFSDGSEGVFVAGLSSPDYVLPPLEPGQIVWADSSLWALRSVDPVTGDRTILTGCSPQTNPEQICGEEWDRGDGLPVQYPQESIVESPHSLLVTKYGGYNQLVRVDVATGDRTILSSFNSPPVGSGPEAYFTTLAVDADGSILTPGPDGIIRVDPVTGNRTLAIPKSRLSFPDLNLGPMARDDRKLFSVGAPPPQVLEIDIDTGLREVLSGETSPGAGPALGYPVDVAIEVPGPNGSLLVLVDPPGAAPGVLMRVDRATGDRSIVSSATVGSGPAFETLTGLAYGPTTDRIYVSNDRASTQFGQLLEVDPLTGDRAVLSSLFVGAGVNPYESYSVSVVPEPARLLALCAGTILLGALYTSKRKITTSPSWIT